MKKKFFGKKLNLVKETVARLEPGEQDRVKGGATWETCESPCATETCDCFSGCTSEFICSC